MIDTDKYKIEDDVIWMWNDDLDHHFIQGGEKKGWVLWEYKECPNGNTVGNDPNKTYSPYHQVLPSLIFECKINERMDAITDLPLILAEVKRLRDLVEFAIATIDSNDCYMGEEAQADLLRHLRGDGE